MCFNMPSLLTCSFVLDFIFLTVLSADEENSNERRGRSGCHLKAGLAHSWGRVRQLPWVVQAQEAVLCGCPLSPTLAEKSCWQQQQFLARSHKIWLEPAIVSTALWVPLCNPGKGGFGSGVGQHVPILPQAAKQGTLPLPEWRQCHMDDAENRHMWHVLSPL